MLKKLLSIGFLLSGLAVFSQAPTATVVVPSGTICTEQAVILSSNTTNTTASSVFTWIISPPSGVNFVFGNSQPTVGVTFSVAGIYSASLTVADPAGTVTASASIVVNKKPTAAFSASLTTVGFPNQIDLTNFSTSATNYLWTFSESATTSTNTNESHPYNASGSYTVSLIAVNSNGCTDTSSYSFYLSDSSGITLPNIFTPNADGINDIFKPVARGISSMKVNVYTRFGNFVYGWETINGFWDGYTTSGVICEPGTYFYILEATGFDGKTYKLKSYLTLLRN